MELTIKTELECTEYRMEMLRSVKHDQDAKMSHI
ncbi:hypothetical protein SDC9_111199 [bioreactor metagenome]|uniref:Uncharacterized protein n=1 Tax=bioreactor metagenome TaxID=1076179 RepID=A0A645BM10_9ZZZZ